MSAKRFLRRLLLVFHLLLAASAALALELTFLDVGQGTSVLIEAPSGPAALFDAGPTSGDAAAQLRVLGVTNLGLVVASHADADHIGGMADVLRAFAPRFYLDNGIPHTTLTYERTLRAAQAVGVQLLEPTRRTISLGDVSLTVLPPPGRASAGQNGNSVGLRIDYGDFSALLPGDAEGEEWAWWLQHHSDLLTGIDVHLSSHHGSRNGDTRAALARLAPDVVVISLGANNQYGHPHPEALALYAGASVVRTDVNGRIVIHAKPDGRYEVRVQQAGSTPRAPPPAASPRTTSAPAPPVGCVDVNYASHQDLDRIIHIGPARADAIIQMRTGAPFRSVADLTRVSGIGPARLADIRAQGLACVL